METTNNSKDGFMAFQAFLTALRQFGYRYGVTPCL